MLSLLSDPKAQWLTSSDGGMVNVHTGKRLQVVALPGASAVDDKAKSKAAEEREEEADRSQQEAESEREADDEEVGRPRRTDGPLTADDWEHARELADELRPLFKRMAPKEQVALLTELAGEPEQVRSLFESRGIGEGPFGPLSYQQTVL